MNEMSKKLLLKEILEINDALDFSLGSIHPEQEKGLAISLRVLQEKYERIQKEER